MEEAETKKLNYKLICLVEWCFYIVAAIMTVHTFICLLLVYVDIKTIEFFNVNSIFYWVTVLCYAIARMWRKQLVPKVMKFRKGELFVVFWLIVTLTLAIITTYFNEAKFFLFWDVVKLFATLVGILGGTTALKQVLSVSTSRGIKN